MCWDTLDWSWSTAAQRAWQHSQLDCWYHCYGNALASVEDCFSHSNQTVHINYCRSTCLRLSQLISSFLSSLRCSTSHGSVIVKCNNWTVFVCMCTMIQLNRVLDRLNQTFTHRMHLEILRVQDVSECLNKIWFLHSRFNTGHKCRLGLFGAQSSNTLLLNHVEPISPQR